uniref:Uncharacterized protein n=1 Tax=Trichuris muris TaxID=70415 RepID=A0A5S6QNH4_TRIMR
MGLAFRSPVQDEAAGRSGHFRELRSLPVLEDHHAVQTRWLPLLRRCTSGRVKRRKIDYGKVHVLICADNFDAIHPFEIQKPRAENKPIAMKTPLR